MNELIKQLYDGEIYPAEQIVSTDPEFKPTHRQVDTEMAYLKKILPEEAVSHLDNVEKLLLISSELTCHAGFTYGFKLGIQLMHEAFTEDKKAPLDRN